MYVQKSTAPAGDDVGRDEEADPADNDKHARGKVAGDDVVRHFSSQSKFKPVTKFSILKTNKF